MSDSLTVSDDRDCSGRGGSLKFLGLRRLLAGAGVIMRAFQVFLLSSVYLILCEGIARVQWNPGGVISPDPGGENPNGRLVGSTLR